jgi:excisionase family DNA binding protein
MDRINTPIESIDRTIDSAQLNEIPALIGCLAQLQAKAQLKMLAGHGTTAAQSEALLTVPEIATRLKLSPYRVYELIRQGHLQRVPLPGKSVRVRPSELAAYLARHGP